MSSPDATLADYSRGYRDGVAAASDQIAKFFTALKAEHATALATMRTAQTMVEGVILERLAPLQDEVRKLKP